MNLGLLDASLSALFSCSNLIRFDKSDSGVYKIEAGRKLIELVIDADFLCFVNIFTAVLLLRVFKFQRI